MTVDMKGKGKLTTYWLTAAETNPYVNKEGLAALDVEVKHVLYNADFGTKERCSKKQMDSFSPRKMQKVALSLDKLAMDVLRRTSLLNLHQVSGIPNLEEPMNADPPLQRGNRSRSNSLNLSDLEGESKIPEATDQIYDTLTDIVKNFNGLSEEDVRQEIARALSNSFANMNMSDDALLELEDIEEY